MERSNIILWPKYPRGYVEATCMIMLQMLISLLPVLLSSEVVEDVEVDNRDALADNFCLAPQVNFILLWIASHHLVYYC